LACAAEVRAGRYQRASQDKKEQGKSVGDQGKLNTAEIVRYGWTAADSLAQLPQRIGDLQRLGQVGQRDVRHGETVDSRSGIGAAGLERGGDLTAGR
jgi:hypothetical protein